MAEEKTTGTPDAGATNDPKPSTIILPNSGQIIPPSVESTPADPPPDDPPVEESAVLGHGGKEVPTERIAERVARAERKLLRDHYGTDDPTEVARIRKERETQVSAGKERDEQLDAFKKAEATRKREEMSEKDRLTTDLTTRDDRIKELETELRRTKDDVVVNSQDTMVRDAGAKHIRGNRMKYAMRDLAEHVNGLTEEQRKNFTPVKLDRYFAKFATENPDFALEKEAPAADPPAPTSPPKRRRAPVSTPKAPAQKPAATADGNNGQVGAKTVLPGFPNSMSKQELAAHLKTLGHKTW